ncbi:PH domain-containing protein [Streptomyces sp. NPDC002573]|uniref:PH domain-containing protein n=1 Tax=Streptomyces sp. NPDC002573 TaxID=3364651 RepID=UPI0036B0289B
MRPAVFANDHRLRIRNPFRTITLPLGAVSGLRAGHSSEVFDQIGSKYQSWAIPVSSRGLRQAGRERVRLAESSLIPGGSVPDRRGLFDAGRPDRPNAEAEGLRSRCDRTNGQPACAPGGRGHAQGGPGAARGALGVRDPPPAAAGLVLMLVLLAVG